MKYLVATLLIASLLPLSAAQADTEKPNPKAEIHKTCVYKYLDCMDQCDYHQDESQIASCKAQCNRSYGCRPKKMPTPKSNPLEN